ncbi:AI-2E family transporter [Paracoccus fistulariae]|uniref:AI-2E family transporter n=1 Tax=Paracoccus fistulariae TaxID=658446 RepID=A0ABY7SNA1_9RHOB|nr:AI-2E family transporter [Paracoccus fistulariae]MDB6179936.1 AI-2E family transporter [Paracoccus fistulariae]WCR08033.1 AI-2E family transporter [Paracoccus fistulariae]
MANDLFPQEPARPAPGQQGDIVRLAAWLIVVAIIIGGLYIGQGVLIPLAIAFLISFALSPLVSRLCRWGVPRVLSICIVMATLFMLVAGLGLLVGSQLRMISAELTTYQWTMRQKIDNLTDQFRGPGIFDGAIQTVDTVQKELSDAVQENADEAEPAQRVQVVAPPRPPLQTALEWLVPAVAPLATAGIVLVFVFLALLDRGDLRDRLIHLLGGNLHRSTDTLEEAGKRISKYLLMQVLVNVAYAVPLGLGLFLIGVPGWLLWAVLASVLRFIPYVGPMLSAIFPVALAFAVDPGWNMVLMTIALIVTLEAISGNIVEPFLYGTSTGLSALSLIAAATFWTALWGPVGLILSTPLTVCLLVIGRNLPQLQFLDTLLGSTPVLDVPTRIYQRLLANQPDEAIEIVDDVIEKEGSVTEFYNEHGLALLRLISQDYTGAARAEHRLRVAKGLDEVLDDLQQEYPSTVDAAAPPRVACIGGKWEVDSFACEMLTHALTLKGVAAVQRPAGVVTARYVDKLDLDEVQIICLGYFSRKPERAIRAFIRRLRHRWPEKQIVLALWNAPEDLLEPDRYQALGADAAITSIEEGVLRIEGLLQPEASRDRSKAALPENEQQRIAALRATRVLDGHAREDLDALAKRAADVFDAEISIVSAIDENREFIIGQSKDLPGTRSQDGSDMITMPRAEAICDHVVATGKTLVVEDTDRDPRFADHPAIRNWQTRFYAGVPLTTGDGLVLGALCLLDRNPRKLEDEELDLLDRIAADAVSVITGDDVIAPEPREAEESSATVGQSLPD